MPYLFRKILISTTLQIIFVNFVVFYVFENLSSDTQKIWILIPFLIIKVIKIHLLAYWFHPLE